MRTIAVVAALAAVCQVSCFGSTSGDLSANGTGDLSRPLAERRDPRVGLTDRCGTGDVTELGKQTLRRKPYLQQVTDQSAMVLLTSTGSAAPELRVTTPDGRLVTSAFLAIDASANYTAPQYAAKVEGLTANQTYCYEIAGLTERAAFRTSPPRGSTETVRFIAFGDSGNGSEDQKTVMRQMTSVPFDFILHMGDMAYERGRRGEIEAQVFGVYAPLLRNFPMFAVSGNHEYSTELAAPFREAFALPENGGDAGRERWYSFDWGPIHFVGLDTELIGPQQAAWLEADLAQNQQPWTIVSGHRPPYSSGEHGSSKEFRTVFGPTLELYGVDLVLSGHEHDYERTKPINGVTYIVTGGGGRETRDVGRSAFTAFSEAVLHFVYVEVTSDELVLHAIDGVGREFDQAYVARRD
jgi:3',5'-cyclic AMP phosphodiesterase CpdA